MQDLNSQVIDHGSDQFICSALSDSLQPHRLQHSRPPCPSPTSSLLKFTPIELMMPSNHLILCFLLILPHSIFPSIRVFSNDSSLHQVAIQHKSFQWIFRTDFLQEWLIGPAWSPRDSPEPSPTPQFKSINSSALSFLYSPTLTSIHDYWKNHSFD